MKQKFLQILALLALVVVPWTGQAQSGCTIRVAGEDSYGDGWNGGSLDIIQGTDTLGNFALTGGSGELNVVLPTDDPVSFVWNSGAWDSEVTVYIYDGGNTLAHSVNTPTAGTIYTMSSPCPSCLPATQLTANDVATDGFTLSWTASSTATSYAIYLDGSLVTDGVTATSYTFSGLNANTLYSVGVQAVCSADDSANIVSRDVRTSCGLTVLPYSTGFEDAAFNGAWYPCWDSTIHAGTDPSVNNNTVHTGTYSMYLQATTSESYNLVVGPEMDATGDNIFVRFWANLAGGWLKAGVITDANDTSTFIPLVTIENVSGWNEYEFNTAALDPTAEYRVAWLGYRSVSYYSQRIASIDDVYISEIPSCLRVTEVVFDTATSSDITIHWPSVGSSAYTVYYTAAGTTDTLTYTVSDTTATLTGLDALTQYYVYVVANCADGDGEPSPTYSFATACDASTCFLTAYVTDSYDDSWNGCAINVVQAGVTVAVIECPDDSSGSTFSYEVCSTAPVQLTFTRGSYPNEMGGTVKDGSGATVFTIENMGSHYTGDVLATLAIPCPSCTVPLDVYLSDTTATGVTIHWTAGEGQSAWVVTVDSVEYAVTDTFFTVSNLVPLTAYTVEVATDCGGDLSNPVSVSFVTSCGGATCESVVEMTDSYGDGWNGNAIEVYQSGVLVGTASITGSASSASASISVCSGVPVEYRLHVGSYSSEIGFTIYDGGGAEVYTAAQGSMASATDGMLLDSVADPCPTCITPNGVMATAVDSAMLTFVWDVVAGNTYLTSFNGGAFTVNNTGSQTEYNLDANTVYTFSVKAVCSVGDTSNARTISQKTACGQMAIPYIEDFEASTGNEVPSCWTAILGNPVVNDYAYAAHGGNNSLSVASGDMIASSAIPLQGDSIYVSFWAELSYAGTLEAGVVTNPLFDSTFVPMVTVPATGDYALYEFNTSTLSPDSVYYLAFRVSGGYNSAYIDDINIDRYEGCMYPTALTATPDTVAASVSLSWTNNASSSDFVVEYRENGNNAWSAPINVPGGTSYTLTGLDYSTSYEIRVGLACGSDTLWVTTTAMTICQMHTVPYFENFNSADGTLPPCWDYTNASYFHWNRWTTHAETSGNGEMMVGSYSAGEAAILPMMNVPIVKLEISFDAKLGNVSEGDAIMMGAYDNATGTVEWLDSLTIPGQCRESFVRFTYNYLSYTGTGTRIAIGHSHNHTSDWGMAIDSIIVVELANCNPPENLTAHNTMYPNTADDVYFTWTVNNDGAVPSGYQVYIDTITSTVIVDSVADSLLINVDTNYYMPPINTLAEGAHYRLFVRSVCGTNIRSGWVEMQNGFATDEYWMNNTGVADTIVGCDFIIYDNGGPVAGYLHNSNSALVIQAGEVGRELQLQGGFFSHGDDANTFTVYDGIGVNDSAVLYSRNVTSMTETIDSVLATSTTGALTITFTSGYYAALGYELYIHCVGDASCEKPTNLQVEMVGEGQAYATWNSTGASLYRVYHHASGDSVWNMNPTTTNSITLSGLPADVNYDFYVVAYCSSDDYSAPSIIRHFNTHYDVPVCDPVSDLSVSDVSQTSATLAWVSDGNLWEVELNGTVVSTTDNPCALSGLTAGTDYSVRVRNVCDVETGFYSEWSAAVDFTTDTVPVEPQGIDDVAGAAAVAMYPNPASSTVTIDIKGVGSDASVSVIDLNGRICGTWKAENGQLVIDLGSYARGAYFVRVTGETASVIRKLILR